MSTKRFFYTAVGALSITGALAACTTPSSNNPSMTDAAATATAPGPGLWKTSDLVFEYRRQAEDLREMARHLDMEASLYAQRQDEEQATRKRELAKDARAAADAADQRSRDYRRQLPHGQIY